ncbi:hypothetical protein DFH09DRAFT_990470 [Mycena vulgaris]|nr:hypothetical protein DFH09DRAFT_990470 [Mycena vulgaris]
MTSVAALQTRIEELSLAIRRQKDILRDLEQTKSDVQSELNSIIDPMERLPLEVSSDIFMRCLPGLPIAHCVIDAPLVFLNVCRSWNKIAISTPSLWATIRIEPPCSDGFGEILELWISRARNRPLSIFLRGPLYPDVCRSVRRNAHQVQTLELYLPCGDDLEHLTTPFPSLQTLVIGQGYDQGESGTYSDDGRECIELLRGAPELVDCTFHGLFYHPPHFIIDVSSELSHPTLKHLRLRNNTTILLHLTLPGLESLSILALNISHDAFLAFLTRSSPPLKLLEMLIPWGDEWPGTAVEGLFRLLPGLTDLCLTLSSFSPPFLEVLAIGSPPQFLPNLRNLTINGLSRNHSQYEQLVNTLSTRRASRPSQMQTFRLLWPSPQAEYKPDDSIILLLRQLVADGMEIHIGTEEENFI